MLLQNTQLLNKFTGGIVDILVFANLRHKSTWARPVSESEKRGERERARFFPRASDNTYERVEASEI